MEGSDGPGGDSGVPGGGSGGPGGDSGGPEGLIRSALGALGAPYNDLKRKMALFQRSGGSNSLGTTFLYTSWTSRIRFWGPGAQTKMNLRSKTKKLIFWDLLFPSGGYTFRTQAETRRSLRNPPRSAHAHGQLLYSLLESCSWRF